MPKFTKLDVPYQWKDEFTKYPHGYTIFEALCKWVKQVDNMVDNINNWNDYLDNFVENFEFELQEEVQSTITRWQNEGLLDEIIASALNTELDNVKTSLDEQLFSVKNFEHLVVNGDWTEAFRATAEAIRGTNKIFFIPDGRFLVTDGIDIYNSVECRGVVVWNGNLSADRDRFLKILRNVQPISLSVDSLSGLDEGSTIVEGLTGYKGGTLRLSSSEELIKRADGNPPHPKNEVSSIVDENGSIYPALACTYTDKTKLTAIVYPKENTLYVRGLVIEINSTTDLSQTDVALLQRSNVVFDDFTIRNLSATKFNTGLGIVFSTNIVINRPNITGAKQHESKGYGITISHSSAVVINDGYIPEGRHSISGVTSKNVTIRGGVYRQIDSHYGFDYTIDGVTTYAGVLFAGKNLTIQNSTVKGKKRLLSIRNDTPELRGKVIINNINIEGTERIEILTYSSAGLSFDFGRTIMNPDHVSITNIKAKTVDNVYILWIPTNRDYLQRQWGTIFVQNIDCREANGGGFEVIRANWSGEAGSITVRDVYLKDDSQFLVDMRSLESALDESAMFDLTLDNIQGKLYFRVETPVVRNVNVSNCLVKTITRFNDYQPNKDWYFKNCVIDSVSAKTNGLLHFHNCLFKGAISGLSDTSGRIQSSIGNIADVDCTGHPTLNGYVNTSRFKV